MTYTTNDGKVVQGETAEEVGQDLRATSLIPERSLQEYVDGVARRAFESRGIEVRTDTLEHFLADLQKDGLMCPVTRN